MFCFLLSRLVSCDPNIKGFLLSIFFSFRLSICHSSVCVCVCVAVWWARRQRVRRRRNSIMWRLLSNSQAHYFSVLQENNCNFCAAFEYYFDAKFIYLRTFAILQMKSASNAYSMIHAYTYNTAETYAHCNRLNV